jgi:hypothetical protein
LGVVHVHPTAGAGRRYAQVGVAPSGSWTSKALSRKLTWQ